MRAPILPFPQPRPTLRDRIAERSGADAREDNLIDLVQIERDIAALRESAYGPRPYRPRHLKSSWWRRLAPGR